MGKEVGVTKILALSSASGLATGTANNYINNRYLKPKYSAGEQYYRRRLKNGKVIKVRKSNSHGVGMMQKGGSNVDS